MLDRAKALERKTIIQTCDPATDEATVYNSRRSRTLYATARRKFQ
ncbi:hypothetical protein [Sphingomonas sp. 66-10]|jgi:hypothetical protein|nr:hypothetical protein [Sphingomonas sp. 66-10]